jgi:hypothetical protein
VSFLPSIREKRLIPEIFKRNFPVILIGVVTLFFFICSPVVFRFGLTFFLQALSDRDVSPEVVGVSGWMWRGFDTEKVNFTYSGTKVELTGVKLSILGTWNSPIALSIEAERVAVALIPEQQGKGTQNSREGKPFDLNPVDLLKSGWPWWFSKIKIENFQFFGGISAQGIFISEQTLKAALIISSAWNVDSLSIESANLRAQDSRIKWKGSGRIFLNGREVAIVLTRDADNEFTFFLFGEGKALDGLNLNLRWKPGEGPIRIVVRMSGEVFLQTAGFAGELTKGKSDFRILGDLGAEIALEPALLEALFQKDPLKTLKFDGLMGKVILENNGVEFNIDGKGYRVDNLNGVINFDKGLINAQSVRGRCLDLNLIIGGTVDIRSMDCSMTVTTQKTMTPEIMQTIGLSVPEEIDFSIPCTARMDYRLRPGKGNETSGRSNSGRPLNFRGGIITYRIESGSGKLNLYGEKFGIESVLLRGQKGETRIESKLAGRGGNVSISGILDKTGVFRFDFSSSAFVPGKLGAVEVSGPVRFAGKGRMGRGFDIRARILLEKNAVSLSGITFTDVKGAIDLDQFRLRGKGLKGDLFQSPVDVSNYEHNLKTGDFAINADAMSLPADRVLSASRVQFGNEAFLSELTISGRMGVKLSLSRKSGKWSSAVKNSYHGNPVTLKLPHLQRLFPDLTMKVSGFVNIEQGQPDFSGLTVNGKVPDMGVFTLRGVRKDEFSELRSADSGIGEIGVDSLVMTADEFSLAPLLSRLTRVKWIHQVDLKNLRVRIPGPLSVMAHARSQKEGLDQLVLKAQSGELHFSGFNSMISDIQITIDPFSETPGIMAMDADFHGGKLRILDLRSDRLGSMVISDASLSDIFEKNSIVPVLDGRVSLNSSATRIDKGHWVGRVAALIKKGAVMRGLIPQMVIDKLFKTPFVNPMELDWAGVVFRFDTGSEWLLSTYEPEKAAEGEELWPEAPYYLKVESDKMKLAGDIRIGRAQELEATLVAQFPSSVSQYVKLGPYRSFFTRRGGALVPFRKRRETAVYLPFKLSGTIRDPNCDFDPEKHILRQVVGNPLKLFNFIVPNLF